MLKKLSTLLFIIATFLFLGFSPQAREIFRKPECGNCNVIIVAYDALQAAHVSHLGYKNETTPMIDKLAQSGVSFGNAISVAPWTVPSFMTMFTGLYPSEHKIVNKFFKFTKDEKVISNLKKLSPGVTTLAEVFKNNGYVTGGFTGDAGVSRQFGYGQGFDVYTDEETFGSIGNSGNHALEWLKQNKNKKFFMFLHGYDAHGQFKVPDGYQGRFIPKDYKGPFKGTAKEQRDLREEGLSKGSVNLTPEDVKFWRGWYDSKIRDEDDRFGSFWNEFQKLGLSPKTIIVIISDHGTEFYEHKRFDHGFSLYDELVRVPMVFSGPGIENDKIVNEQVSTLDLAPTVLDLVGLKADTNYKKQIRGRSLASFLKGDGGKSEDVFMETDYRNYTHKRGIRTADGWKLVMTMETQGLELYNLRDDPAETKNLAYENPRVAFELKERVLEHIKQVGANPNGPWEIGCLPVYQDQCQ